MNSKQYLHHHGPKIGVAVLSTALALAPSFAQADTLSYQTGFELPTFLLGPLEGQDNWLTVEGIVEISDENPDSGDQSIVVPGEGLIEVDWSDFLWARSYRVFIYDTIANGTPLIEITVHTQLEGPSTDSGQDTADDLFSANIQAYAFDFEKLKNEYLGELVQSSSGEVWIFGSRDGDEYAAGIPIDLADYHSLGMRINFDTRTHQFFVDGDLAATLPIKSSITTDVFAAVMLPVGSVNDPDLIDPSEYTAYYDNFSINAFKPIPVDAKPSSCPNSLNVKSGGVLPVAILGTEALDVFEIDPASVRLVTAQGGESIMPLRWSIEDVATPFEPYTGKETPDDCNGLGPDGFLDLTLKFDQQEIVAALGAVENQQFKLFTVTGKLIEELGNTPIIGEDIVMLIVRE
jgi:hypothetical protein